MYEICQLEFLLLFSSLTKMSFQPMFNDFGIKYTYG